MAKSARCFRTCHRLKGRRRWTLTTRRSCCASRRTRWKRSFARRWRRSGRRKTCLRGNSPRALRKRKTGPSKSRCAILISTENLMARFSAAVSDRRRAAQAAIISYLPGLLISAAVILLPLAALPSVRQRDDASRVPQPQSQVTEKLGKPRQLDKGVRWKRDPATGELITSYAPAGGGGPRDSRVPKLPRGAIIQTVEIVPISCSVFAPDGAPLRDLVAKNFRVYDDDVERPIAFFDAGARNVPEHVAVVIDASPSVLPETADMKQAAMALVDGLAPTAQ